MNPDTKSPAPIMAANTPVAVRSRLRNRPRSTIRQMALSLFHKSPKTHSSEIARPRLGGSGRIASAGFNRSMVRDP